MPVKACVDCEDGILEQNNSVGGGILHEQPVENLQPVMVRLALSQGIVGFDTPMSRSLMWFAAHNFAKYEDVK